MPGNINASRLSQWIGSTFVVLLPLTIYWPIGLPLVVAILPIYVTPGLYLTDIIAFVLICLVLFRVVIKQTPRQFVVNKKITLLFIPLLALVCLAIFTSSQALSPALARYSSLRWLVAFCVYCSLLLLEMPVNQMVKVFLVGLAIQALIGIGQVIHQGPLNLPGELALSPDQFRAAVVNVGGISWLRAYGLTFHPNLLGGLLCAGLILGLPFLEQRIMRLVWWLITIGLVLSFSRSAWLAAAVTFPLATAWVYWKSPKLRRPITLTLVPAAVAVVLVLLVFRTQLLTRLNPLETFSEFSSLAGRGQLIAIALASIRQQWLTGIGAGNFPILMTAYQTLDPPHYVHHVPLLLASEVGLLGGAIWYWLWLVPTISLERFWRGNNPMAIVLIAAWFAWCMISLWDSYPWALESGRLFSVTLLAWITKVCIS